MKNLKILSNDLKKKTNKAKKLYLVGITSLSLALASLTGCTNKVFDNNDQYESPIDTETDKAADKAIKSAEKLLNYYENTEVNDELKALLDAVNDKKIELSFLLKGIDKTGEANSIIPTDRVQQCIDELNDACNKLANYAYTYVVNNNITPQPTTAPTTTPDEITNTPQPTAAPTTKPSEKPSETIKPTAAPTTAPTSTPVWTPEPTQGPIPIWTPEPTTAPTSTPVWTPTPTGTQTPQPTTTPSGTQNITDEELNQLIADTDSNTNPYGDTTGNVDPNNIYQGEDGDYYVNTTPQPTITPAPQTTTEQDLETLINNVPAPSGTYNANGYIWASYDEYLGWIENGCGEFFMDNHGVCWKDIVSYYNYIVSCLGPDYTFTTIDNGIVYKKRK